MGSGRSASPGGSSLEKPSSPDPKNGPTSQPEVEVKPQPDVEVKPAAQPEAPEGGTKAWLSLMGAFCATFVSFGWVTCIGVFQAEYESNQLKQYSKSTVSWITSMEFFFMLFMSPVAGWMFDCYGPRLPVFCVSILHLLGLMMTSLSKEYYQFALSQSVCSGIGSSFVLTPSMTSPMTYFKKKRGLAGGLAIAGSSLGGVVFPIMVAHLLPKVGFGWTIRICAFLILFMLTLTNLTISSNLKHRKKPFKISNFVRPLREHNYLILCISSFFVYWGMFIPFNYIVSAAIHYGMSETAAFNLVPIMNGASFIGRTVPNMLADRYGRFNILNVMVVFAIALILGLWLPGRSSATSFAFAALFGIASGSVISLRPVVVMSISPLSEVGTRMGTIFAVAGIGCLTSPPVGGAIVEATRGGSYVYACVFSGVNFFISLLLTVWLRVRIVGWGLTTKG